MPTVQIEQTIIQTQWRIANNFVGIPPWVWTHGIAARLGSFRVPMASPV